VRKIKWSVSLVLIVIFLSGCEGMFSGKGECDRLKEILKTTSVETALIDWVDKNISNVITSKRYSRSGGVVPGNYKVDINFNWRLLGLDGTHGGVRLVSNRNDSRVLSIDDVGSVSFADKSRLSVLVNIKPGSDFGKVYEHALFKISDRTAVYCLER